MLNTVANPSYTPQDLPERNIIKVSDALITLRVLAGTRRLFLSKTNPRTREIHSTIPSYFPAKDHPTLTPVPGFLPRAEYIDIYEGDRKP